MYNTLDTGTWIYVHVLLYMYVYHDKNEIVLVEERTTATPRAFVRVTLAHDAGHDCCV